MNLFQISTVILDKYFRHTVLLDILVALAVSTLGHLLFINGIINIPEPELLLSLTSDISNIAFTSAGFVLTFLTLLVSFKISSDPIKKKKRESLEHTYNKVSLFNIFLNSPLYAQTIRHLRIAVKELILLALIGYIAALISSTYGNRILFYYIIIGFSIISIVLWKSLLVLSGVMSIKDKEAQ